MTGEISFQPSNFSVWKKRLSLSCKFIHQPDGQIRQHFVLKSVDSFHIPDFTADLWNTKNAKKLINLQEILTKTFAGSFPPSVLQHLNSNSSEEASNHIEGIREELCIGIWELDNP